MYDPVFHRIMAADRFADLRRSFGPRRVVHEEHPALRATATPSSEAACPRYERSPASVQST